MKPKFWADFPGGDYPGVVGAEHAHWQGHFHGHVNALRSILDYAVVTNDSRLKAFVRDGYEWSRQAQGGIPVIGQVGDGQGCGIGRLIGLAVKLSYHGVGDYWEDVDQYIRNHAVEYQITAKDVLRMIGKADLDAGEYELPQDVLRKLGPGNLPAASGLPGITAADVIRAAIGEIPGSASKTASWQCCGSHGNMSFFYAWDGALRHSDGVVRVNLLLNRASPWMDVDSYLPFKGKVVLKNRAAQEAFVRIPFWVEKKSVECRMGTEVVRSKWLGRYLRFENLKPLDVLTITFPMAERTEKWTRPLTVQPPAISDGKLAMPGLLAALVDGVDRKDVKVSVDAQSNSEAVLILRHKDHKFLLAVYVPGSGIYFHEYRNDAYGPPLARVDPGQFGPNIHLTAEAKGSEIMLTVADGKRSVSTHHSIEHIHQSGTVGLYHNHTPTQMFDNFVASDPEGKMIFEDRFDGPNGPYTKWHNAFGDGKWEENIGTLKFKGNTLIEASPPMSPLYDGRSEKYRASNAPMRKVTRYVTSQVLEW